MVLPRLSERESIAGWGRSQATSAAGANHAYNAFADKIIAAGKTSTGVSISAVSPHVYDRTKERKIKAGGIIDALTNPLKTNSIRIDRSPQFIGEAATVAINVDTGKVISVWPTSTKKADKLKGVK